MYFHHPIIIGKLIYKKEKIVKKGRPKIYYDFANITRKPKVEESLDYLFKEGIINRKQHKLGLKLRWMFTVNFGLPTVQAYNMNKVKGRGISKYDEESLLEIRDKYKEIINFLYGEDKDSAKELISVIIHHKQPDKNIRLIMTGIENLEVAFGIRKKEYNTISNSNEKLNSYLN